MISVGETRNTVIDAVTESDHRQWAYVNWYSKSGSLFTSQAPDKPHRRIDLRMIPIESFWCGLLYFTGSSEHEGELILSGSDFFNKQMRQIALEKGFTLSEYTICPIGTGLCCQTEDFRRDRCER